MTSLLLPAALSLKHPGYRSARYYPTHIASSTSASTFVGGASGPMCVYPFVLHRPISVAGLYTRVITGVASTNIKLAVYANDPTLGLPVGAPLLVVNTQQSTATSGTTVGAAAAGTLAAGVYWAAIVGDSATGAQFFALSSSDFSVMALMGRTSLSGSSLCALSTPVTFSSNLPTLVGNETWTEVSSAGPPILFLQTS